MRKIGRLKSFANSLVEWGEDLLNDRYFLLLMLGITLLVMTHECTHWAVAASYGVPSEIHFGFPVSYTIATPEGQARIEAMTPEVRASLNHDQATVEMYGYFLFWLFPMYCLWKSWEKEE